MGVLTTATVRELGLLAGANVAVGVALRVALRLKRRSPERGRDATARTLYVAALTNLLLSGRWSEETCQLVAAALLARAAGLVRGSPSRTALAAIFVVCASEAIPRFTGEPSASTMHPQFIATMAALTGVGGRRDVVAFRRAPRACAAEWARTGDARHTREAHATKSVLWSLRVLGPLVSLCYVPFHFLGESCSHLDSPPLTYLRKYSFGALAKCAAALAGAGGVAGAASALRSRAPAVASNVMRTTALYTLVSQYCNAVYARCGRAPPRWAALPFALFALETAKRSVVLAEYYVTHTLYALLSSAKARLRRPRAASLLFRLAPALLLLPFVPPPPAAAATEEGGEGGAAGGAAAPRRESTRLPPLMGVLAAFDRWSGVLVSWVAPPE